jgi:hypothetical protein
VAEKFSIYWLPPGPAVSVLAGGGSKIVVLELWFVASGERLHGIRFVRDY